jgi:hypothetical protein
MPNGKLIYPSGDPDQVTYIFPKNYDYGHRPGARLDLNDNQRAHDGTLHRYSGPIKKKYELPFSKVSTAQKDYFLDLWDFQCPVDLYLDGTNFDATVIMMECPDPESQAAFVGGEHTWSFNVMFEEV